MRTRLIFVRHAEAEGNVKRLFHGWYNSDLTEKGEEQAKLVAGRLKKLKVDVLYSSVLNRTYKTATYISKELGLPIKTSEQLKEINGGDWEDVSWADIPKMWPLEHNNWEKNPHLVELPNGESMVGFQERLLREVYRIIHENEGKTILIVTHGTAIKALKCKFTGVKLKDMMAVSWCDNTAVTVVDYESDTGKFDLKIDGDVSHLPFNLRTIVHQDWWQNLNRQGRVSDGKEV
ncbi:MAG: histidine phosphatase family protein [Clostridiales bacterium]|nr:histidine phosphatase family protein [Clostridiales bacterium]